jgi:hypothetical protein
MNTSAPQLVWPSLLELPPADVLIVYLDLNHWIGLAQTLAGHPKGAGHGNVLQACRAARSAGKALFVLSGTIYAEVQKIKDPMQEMASDPPVMAGRSHSWTRFMSTTTVKLLRLRCQGQRGANIPVTPNSEVCSSVLVEPGWLPQHSKADLLSSR